MQRTASGKRSFSFSRFISNAVPNLALGPQQYDLDIAEQDALFDYQLREDDPTRLNEMSFLCGGITRSNAVSSKVYRALLKNAVLQENPPRVDTSKITRQFAHELAVISSHAQKKLINLLFFWEEEMMRMKVLKEEAEELKIVIGEERELDSERHVGGYEKRLKELEGLIKLKPSLRSEEAKKNEDLPGYSDGKRPANAPQAG